MSEATVQSVLTSESEYGHTSGLACGGQFRLWRLETVAAGAKRCVKWTFSCLINLLVPWLLFLLSTDDWYPHTHAGGYRCCCQCSGGSGDGVRVAEEHCRVAAPVIHIVIPRPKYAYSLLSTKSCCSRVNDGVTVLKMIHMLFMVGY